MLVLVGERRRLLRERLGVELVRRHVGEVARAVRAVGEQRRALGCGAYVVAGLQDDPLDRLRPAVLLRLPAPGRVAADDRALDERSRLLREGERQALVEPPRQRSADAGELMRRRGARGPQRVAVDLFALADARRH